MQGRFVDKVVIVTGATSGIGREAAIRFAREGAKVVVAGRRQSQGDAVVGDIAQAGGEALFVRTDVADEASVSALVSATLERYGRLDCAFNNAGIGGESPKRTADHTKANWDAVLGINLTGTWLSMKYEIPAMLASGGGAIVNTSSIYGLKRSDMGHVPYAVSKHGVLALTKTAAYEYAKKGLRVNAVCPGWTHSEMIDPALETDAKFRAFVERQIPMGRVADTGEIADAVLWLCSAEAAYVNGHALSVDGGVIG
jgi:NAD(P)-dependent dehydrogenase (short-subunit alcohol dehydrogenase family)